MKSSVDITPSRPALRVRPGALSGRVDRRPAPWRLPEQDSPSGEGSHTTRSTSGEGSHNAQLPLGESSHKAPVLLERRPVTGDLLRLTLSRPPGFSYRPGQHVKMGVAGLLRSYSLVSAPHEPHLEFFVELFPGGRLSERLRAITAGAAMAVENRAKGDLRLHPHLPVQLMIATVTGIAPYLSMLRDHLHQPRGIRRRFIILHGASYANELGYLAELSALAQRHPGYIVYIPTVSRPESVRNRGWSGERGRVEGLAAPIVRRLRLSPTDTAAFACGHPGMVNTVAAMLRKLGFATMTEPFD